MTNKTLKKALTDQDNTETVVAPLTLLEVSDLNPRHKPDETGLEALALSIKAVGLLQNLIGIKDNKKIKIVAGGRRLKAMQILAKQGDIETDKSVLVRLATTKEQALQWAATENEARENFSPAEEVRAYKAMLDAEMNPEQIAIANAKTVRHVKGRLRLAGLSECILNALEAEEITLDTASAYTLSDSHEEQNALFETLHKHSWSRNDTHHIRTCLTSEFPDMRDNRAIFVGRELYEKKGGIIREDLFGEEVYFLDTDLLDTLAQQKMDQIEIDFKAQGWKWVQMQLTRRPYELYDDYDVIKPSDPFVEDGTHERMEEIEGAMNRSEATDDELAEYDLHEESIQPQFNDQQKAASGVMIFLGYNHELNPVCGLVGADDRADAIASGLIEIKEEAPTKQIEESGPYSQALTKDMTTIRTGAIQNAILADADLARDLAIFALCYPTYADASPIMIGSRIATNMVDDHGQNLPDDLMPYPSQHLTSSEAAEAFEKFTELSEKMKAAMLTEAVAKSFHASLFTNGQENNLVEVIAHCLEVNVRETWTPNTAFFNRLKSIQLDEVMAFILDRSASQSFVKSPKRDKVARLDALFNNEVDRRGFSKAEQERIVTWSPECLSGIPLAELSDDGRNADSSLKQAA